MSKCDGLEETNVEDSLNVDDDLCEDLNMCFNCGESFDVCFYTCYGHLDPSPEPQCYSAVYYEKLYDNDSDYKFELFEKKRDVSDDFSEDYDVYVDNIKLPGLSQSKFVKLLQSSGMNKKSRKSRKSRNVKKIKRTKKGCN